MNSLKQKILIDRVRRGDQKAFKEIYQVFSDRIYRFIFFRLPQEADAKDLLQETFLNLWNYLTDKDKQEKKIKNLQAFIYRIAKNLIAGYYRQRDGKQSNIDIEEVKYKLSDEKQDNFKKEIDLEIRVERVKEQLSILKNETYREVIQLKYLDELNHKEIAEILDKSEQSVRVTLHRAIKKLKEDIKNEK